MSEGPGLVMVGLPGSGKSTVGRAVAARLGRRFVDIDDEVLSATRMTAAQHIDRGGEAAFRAVEREAVQRLIRQSGTVIATGGGTIIDPLNRWALSHHGPIIWLEASAKVAGERLRRSPIPRPMFKADPVGTLETVSKARAPFYRMADHRVDGDGSGSAVAALVLDALGEWRPGWRVLFDAEVPRDHPFGPPSARVVFGRDLDAAALGRILEPFGGRVPAVIADERLAATLPALSAALPGERRLDIGAGEAVKRMSHLERVLEWLSDNGVERGDPLLAAGGGTVGDLAGVAAALYLRGIPLVNLPTTWVAMADSAIGGKTAVDLARAKNAAGAFWPAWAIVADVTALATLPEGRARDGMAESLKCGLIGDAALWDLVETRGPAAMAGTDPAARYAIMERAARLKLDVVERDPFERGPRRALNLGHTLAHALEVESGYTLSHGEAVALGLRAVLAIAAGRGAETGLAARVDSVLAALGFPLTRRFDVAATRAAL
ncbi:MAG: bifunctional shikimate kinase/3-dehydroquinate synthase, partial [Candidatus Limnocylindrales bacterium]